MPAEKLNFNCTRKYHTRRMIAQIPFSLSFAVLSFGVFLLGLARFIELFRPRP